MEFAARITGTGSAFPERRVTNDDIARELTRFGLETNNQWIIERTGIIERRISNVQNEAETNSSLGARAAQIALERAGRKPEDIDQIIYATCSPDTLMPSTACWLQQKIGARRAWAMDINAACSGFIYGVVTAEQFILSGHSKTVLVVGAEVLSQLINWQDRKYSNENIVEKMKIIIGPAGSQDTGIQMASGLTGAILFGLKENHPELFGRIDKFVYRQILYVENCWGAWIRSPIKPTLSALAYSTLANRDGTNRLSRSWDYRLPYFRKSDRQLRSQGIYMRI